MKKILSTIMALVLSLSLFGCFGGKPPKVNEKMSQLYVFAYDCGYGRDYTEELFKRFAEQVKDKSYQEGKAGVEIIPDYQLNDSTGDVLLTQLENKRADLFFSGYISPSELMSSGKIMDLTEVVNEEVVAGEKSIMGKMDAELSNYYKSGADKKVYGLPLFDAFSGLFYDAGLLNSKKLWIGENSNDTSITLVGEKGEKSLGADGEKGTYDDGLPDTFAQFYLWCDKMITDKGTVPFNWSGIYQFHFDAALTNFWATYEGKDQMMLNYTFDGTANNIVQSIDGDTVTVAPQKISTANGNILQKQAGKYYAAQFGKKVADKNEWVYKMSFSGSENHKQAQTTYITSSVTGNKPIAMFADGNWWVSEATQTFKDYEAYGSGKMDRKFAFLPTPKVSRDLVGTNSVVVNKPTGGIMFAKNSAAPHTKEIIKDFIKFMHTNENLSLQNRVAGMTKPFEYEVEKEDFDKMDYYTKNLLELKKSNKVDFLYAVSNNPLFLANHQTFSKYSWDAESMYGNGDITSNAMIKTFRDNASLTAQRYFEGYFENYNSAKGGKTKWDLLTDKIG